jgi:hypothetical protein
MYTTPYRPLQRKSCPPKFGPKFSDCAVGGYTVQGFIGPDRIPTVGPAAVHALLIAPTANDETRRDERDGFIALVHFPFQNS